MKHIFLKNAVVSVSLLLILGYAQLTSAHSQGGSLGPAVGSTDLYQVSCFNDGAGAGATYRLASRILTGPGTAAGKLSVRSQKGYTATNATDAANGNAAYSPFAYNVAGDGVYYLTVGKTAGGTAWISYTVDFHCLGATGGHAGTSIIMLQDQ
jgi:hypothetical protein